MAESPSIGYRCRSCGADYGLDSGAWRCRCGGVFDLEHQVAGDAFADLASQPWSLWRYRRSLPFSNKATAWEDVTLGEGATPLVTGGEGLMLKLDFLMPSLSFKDRGSVVLVTKAVELGVGRMVADSSGNAGTSIAAYAARAGIEVEVFVPESTSEKKVAQLHGFGATVRRVAGQRAAAAAAAIDRVESSGAFYASHVYNPLFHHGTKTFAFEIWEQLGGRLPEAVVVPAGNGTLLLGVSLGFDELVGAGLVERSPRLIAVQAERCAPLARAAGEEDQGGRFDVASEARRWTETAAEGIAIAEPPRLSQMLDAVERSGGEIRTVSEEDISSARRALAGRGIDVEPTAAAAYGAWRAWPRDERPSSAVLALTGAGLKSPVGG
jgi:threonine synthase